MIHVQAITESSQKALDIGSHVCFGISPFNSYFTDEKLYELTSWAMNKFKKMHFFVPDAPSAYTLEALGCSPEKAEWKARRQGQYLANKIAKVLTTFGFSLAEATDCILNWENLINNRAFQALYEKVLLT